MTWRVAQSLDILLAEVNTAAPNRSKISDGSIGDAAHATRESDHNPWVIHRGIGIVRARDFTHDPAHGCDSEQLARRIVTMATTGAGHPAMQSGAYVISNRRIWSWDRRAEGWRAYTGSNPHSQHCHVSVALASDGFDSTAPWQVMGAPDVPEEDDMPLSDADLDKISQRIEASWNTKTAEDKKSRDLRLTWASRTGANILKAMSGLADEIAAAVVADVRNDLNAGGGIEETQLRRIVYAQATRALNTRLGSLDEPEK